MELPSIQSMSLMSAINNSTLPLSSSTDSKDQLQTQQQQQQQYALKWNDFQTTVLKSFQHLRDEEDFIDVTIACDQKSFFAHKVVLSACSPYFRKLLKANPCKHPIIILRDVHTHDMENLLSFMYYGEVNVSHAHLLEFLKTAQMLQIRGLTDITNSCITPGINTSEIKSSSTSTTNKDSSDILPVSDNTSKMSTTESVSTSLTKSIEIAPCISNTSNSGNKGANTNISCNTPAIQSLKASAAPSTRKYNNNKTNQYWEMADADVRNHRTTPPPQKRIKSADLFRAQHGISPDRLLIDIDFPVAGQHPLTRERKDRNREGFRDSERNLEFRESLLNHVMENNAELETQEQVEPEPIHTQSDVDDPNSSDSEASAHGEVHHDITLDSTNGSLDNSRSHSFPSAFLGIQGLLAVPSNIGGNDFDALMTHNT